MFCKYLTDSNDLKTNLPVIAGFLKARRCICLRTLLLDSKQSCYKFIYVVAPHLNQVK
jgi:hypothetical protein